jgi:hypothetical protein
VGLRLGGENADDEGRPKSAGDSEARRPALSLSSLTCATGSPEFAGEAVSPKTGWVARRPSARLSSAHSRTIGAGSRPSGSGGTDRTLLAHRAKKPKSTMLAELPHNALLKGDALFFENAGLVAREEGDFVEYLGIVGDSVLHVIEENLTAAELKHASLRQIAEESIHMDSLLHIIGSLNMDLDEVTARFSDIPSVWKKNAFMTRQMPELKMGIDLTKTVNKQKFAKAIFGITQVMEGTQFYALFAMILSLHRQNKMTGIGQMFQYTLRDESNHIALGGYILTQLNLSRKTRISGPQSFRKNWLPSCAKAWSWKKNLFEIVFLKTWSASGRRTSCTTSISMPIAASSRLACRCFPRLR